MSEHTCPECGCTTSPERLAQGASGDHYLGCARLRTEVGLEAAMHRTAPPYEPSASERGWRPAQTCDQAWDALLDNARQSALAGTVFDLAMFADYMARGFGWDRRA